MKRVLFQNREEGGKLLADQLMSLRQRRPEDIDDSPLVMLAIPRGGVVTGHVIASILGTKLDILISQKIVSPYNFNITIGTCYLFTNLKEREETMINVPRNYIDEQVSRAVKEIEYRLERFRSDNSYNLRNKTVLLVDDGVETGATMLAATQWVVKQKPKELIVAVPVAPKETINMLAWVAEPLWFIVILNPLMLGNITEISQLLLMIM